MSFNDCKISESEIQTTGVQSQADTLTGSAADNKMVFDALPTLVIQKLNSLIDQLQQQAAAGQIGVTPFDGMTAQTLQAALEQIQADIGGNYSGADGAGKVGYTPSEGVDEDTVQEAIEAVQANLTAYIAKIKAATGAAEVGNAPIAGMTATNVQHALEELRKNIDNIVSGIIPGGSITNDMLQGPVSVDKGGTGATTPQGALANLGAGVRPNIADNGNLIDAVNQRQFVSTTQAGRILDRWEISSDATINVTYTKGSGLLLQNLGSAGNLFLTQKRERKLEEEKKYTLSVLTDKGLFSDSLSPGESSYPTSGLYFSVVNRSGYGEFDIGVLAGGNSFLVKYVKVEDGEGQTLAYQGSTGAWHLLPQPESDYATQLAKCQRYLDAMENQTIVRSAYVSTNFVDFLVPIPVSFRVLPIIQSAEKLVLITQPDGANVSGVTWSIATKSSASVRLRASKPNILSEGTDFSVYTDQGATFFSAEL